MATPLEQVVEIVCRIGELPALDPDLDVYEAGLESVRALEVLLELETAFGVSIPDAEFVEHRTARRLADLAVRLQQGAAS